MATILSDNQVRSLHLRVQRLTHQHIDGNASVAQLVKDVCGFQAQEAPAAALAVRVRSSDLLATDVEYARVQERSVVRTWGPRGTLHLLATQDLGWLLPLLGPVFITGNRRRYLELGLDEDMCARGMRAIRDILASQGPLTRPELAEQLATLGIRTEGQAIAHLVGRAALAGILCLGPDHGAKPTYVLLSDWVKDRGPHLSPEAAHVELTLRYLKAYAPATPEDQASWSGMPMSNIRTAWQHVAGQLIEVEIAKRLAWMLKSHAAWLNEPSAHQPIVHLLPAFDIYLLGYKKRDLVVPLQYAKRINAGGGMLHPTLLVDGRAVGTWKSKCQKKHLEIVVEPFDQLALEVHPGLEAEVVGIGHFLEIQTTLHIMTPH